MVKSKSLTRGLVAAILLALTALIVYDQVKLHQEPLQYHFDIRTEDFAINNINLVSTPNHVYLAGGYFMELTGNDTSVDNVNVDGRVSGVRLFDWTSGEPFYRSDINPVAEGKVISGISLDSKSVLHMSIHYTVGGESREYNEDILLKDKIKPLRSTSDGGYAIYELVPRRTTMPQ
ncbi:hypothetical protein [Paenibacillus sp. sgz500958]|uniref:hypothetical protein n=1 Tax=Paenibacillus sp. sgz500958 TaxID=3242475 RepID=UPI0036D27A99